MKKYARIMILLLLGILHIVWITDTGRHYMDDVITLGGLFFPLILPYSLLAAVLSLLLGGTKIEKGCALVLFGVIAVALLQTVSIKVEGDRWHLLSDVRRQFQPAHSLAPWFFIGLCFQQTLVALWKRNAYYRRWFIPFTVFSLAYAMFAYAYITSRIHAAFPLSSSLPDAILVFCLGSLLFGLLWTLILPFYDTHVTVFPYGEKRRGQQCAAPLPSAPQTGAFGGCALTGRGMKDRIHLMGLMLAAGCLVAGCRHLSSSGATVDTAQLTTTSYRTAEATAEVITWRGESTITVLVSNRVVFREAYVSNSGHNGAYVMDAAWAPAGKSFAFKTASAGGHQPYRSPVTILRLVDGKPEAFDAETIIRKIPDISNIAVSHYEKPWLKWLSETKLQVVVMSHDKPSDGGFYVIDLESLSATRPQPTPSGDVLKAAPEE